VGGSFTEAVYAVKFIYHHVVLTFVYPLKVCNVLVRRELHAKPNLQRLLFQRGPELPVQKLP
jgi:hypothetical protein